MTVYVAGSFNKLHDGHKAMLSRAYDLAYQNRTNLRIGLMDDVYLRQKHPEWEDTNKGNLLESVEHRAREISWYLMGDKWDVREFGRWNYMFVGEGKFISFFSIRSPNYMPDFVEGDMLVVSRETLPHTEELIKDFEIKPILDVVEMVLDEEGNELHSTTLVEKELEGTKRMTKETLTNLACDMLLCPNCRRAFVMEKGRVKKDTRTGYPAYDKYTRVFREEFTCPYCDRTVKRDLKVTVHL